MDKDNYLILFEMIWIQSFVVYQHRFQQMQVMVMIQQRPPSICQHSMMPLVHVFMVHVQ